MHPELTQEERAIYEWQMWVPGVGEEGQRKLKGASVLISRVGGLGGLVALELAAAGVGRLILPRRKDRASSSRLLRRRSAAPLLPRFQTNQQNAAAMASVVAMAMF